MNSQTTQTDADMDLSGTHLSDCAFAGNDIYKKLNLPSHNFGAATSVTSRSIDLQNARVDNGTQIAGVNIYRDTTISEAYFGQGGFEKHSTKLNMSGQRMENVTGACGTVYTGSSSQSSTLYEAHHGENIFPPGFPFCAPRSGVKIKATGRKAEEKVFEKLSGDAQRRTHEHKINFGGTVITGGSTVCGGTLMTGCNVKVLYVKSAPGQSDPGHMPMNMGLGRGSW